MPGRRIGRARTGSRSHRAQPTDCWKRSRPGFANATASRCGRWCKDLTDPDVADKVAEATEGSRSGCSSTTPVLRTGRTSSSTTRSNTRSSRSSSTASARSRWFVTSRPRCATAAAAASCWSDRWPAWPGRRLLTVYSAVKAFQHNFAEGLWAELRPHGVDVCCTPLGMTYTRGATAHGCRVRPTAPYALRGRRARDHREHR